MSNQAKQRGKLFVISGPSGVGKTTVTRRVIAALGSDQIVESVSYTTRPPRPEEQDGTEYHFSDWQTFQELNEKHLFLESTLIHGHYYGTGKKPTADLLRSGRHVILVIDGDGAQQVKEALHSAVLIFLRAPVETLRDRLQGRDTENPDAIEARLESAVAELAYLPQYEHVIESGALESDTAAVLAIIQATTGAGNQQGSLGS